MASLVVAVGLAFVLGLIVIVFSREAPAEPVPVVEWQAWGSDEVAVLPVDLWNRLAREAPDAPAASLARAGVQALGGVRFEVMPGLPPDTMYLINPAAMHHEPLTLDEYWGAEPPAWHDPNYEAFLLDTLPADVARRARSIVKITDVA